MVSLTTPIWERYQIIPTYFAPVIIQQTGLLREEVIQIAARMGYYLFQRHE